MMVCLRKHDTSARVPVSKGSMLNLYPPTEASKMQVAVAPKAVLYKLSDPVARGSDIREGREREYKAKVKKPQGKAKGGKRQ